MELENEMISTSSNSSAGSREYKVVMLGAGGVGKSAMTMQFISHRFPDYHDPTIEDAYKTQVRIDDEPAYLDILDTAGQAEFTAMRDQYMRGGEGFIICYSITDRQSFQEAAEFKELIYRVRHTYDIPLVLVGNKIDLEQFRQVSTEEGMSLAREYSCSFFETSAALRFYIDDVFHGLVREIRRKESLLPVVEKKMKRKDSLWRKLKGSLKKKKVRLDGKLYKTPTTSETRESAEYVFIFIRALSGQSFFMAVTFPMFLHDQVFGETFNRTGGVNYKKKNNKIHGNSYHFQKGGYTPAPDHRKPTPSHDVVS